ncbi:arylsulfatase [Roseiconus nitratireducens]|uniref:Arylsulfatase n=1 Tax=Roseiconus nitratireducens TaxID=2605748 RepID=A0A5M6D0R6_9BACT|nr:arylsulfatase [Roseiconus nitratireducens]KAA5539199.1 arylsulfatase [Roseiconus nitratireducens]
MLFHLRSNSVLAIIALAALIGTSAFQPVAAADLPNLVIIFADDVGYGDVGCYGTSHVRTPNIDQLAKQGRRFTDAHSASAVCTPSRYALVTGRYPVRKDDLWGPVFLKSPLVVDVDRTTIADVAKRAGYATACIGKWHLGWGNQSPTDWNAPLVPGPLQLGFDYYFGMPTVNSHPPFVYVQNDRVVGWQADDPFVYGKTAKTRAFDEKFGVSAIGGATAAHELYDDEAVGTTLTAKATEWIRDRAGQDAPFFLYFATTNIHHPFTPAKRFQGTSDAGPYGDFIHELDWIVGEVTQTLDDAGVADDTLLVFTSDNGGMLNRGGQEAYRRGHRPNGQLLGFKFDAWEGGHRVPFIARWPGHIPAGSESGALISNVDLLATVAAIAGQKLGPDEGPDSINLEPALTGAPDTSVREELLIAPARPSNLSLRSGDWMLITGQGGGGFASPKVGDHGFGGPAATRFTGQTNSDIANGKLKPGAPRQQLYNLLEDPGQSTNVIREHPDVAERMRERIRQIKSNR